MQHDHHTVLNMEHRVSGPDYRWKLAQQRAGSHQGSSSQRLDEPTRHAAAYLRLYDEAGWERAKRAYPVIDAACTLLQNDQAFQIFKLSVLGNLPRDECAARLGVEQDVIEIAEALFFDISYLRPASGWMNCHVFMPEVKAGSTDLAAKMKLAFYGGPAMARALLDAQETLPMDEAQRLVDQETLLYSKLQAALEFELDVSTAAEFAKNLLEYDLARRNLELEREKFQYLCELAREKPTGDEVQQNDAESPAEVSSGDSADGDGADGLAAAESVKHPIRVARGVES